MATFAIAPGAGDVAWSWHLVVAELERRGHRAVAVDLPSEDDEATLSDYADTLIEAVGDRDDVVVVGHSLGGYTATLAAERLNAELLVLVSAMVPRAGETASEWAANTGYSELPQHDGDETSLFLHDVEPALAAEALRRGREQSGTPMNEPWPLDSWPDVKTRYLALNDDRCFPTDFIRTMVRDRLGIDPDEMPGSHCAFLSRPEEMAERLEGYAGRV